MLSLRATARARQPKCVVSHRSACAAQLSSSLFALPGRQRMGSMRRGGCRRVQRRCTLHCASRSGAERQQSKEERKCGLLPGRRLQQGESGVSGGTRAAAAGEAGVGCTLRRQPAAGGPTACGSPQKGQEGGGEGLPERRRARPKAKRASGWQHWRATWARGQPTSERIQRKVTFATVDWGWGWGGVCERVAPFAAVHDPDLEHRPACPHPCCLPARTGGCIKRKDTGGQSKKKGRALHRRTRVWREEWWPSPPPPLCPFARQLKCASQHAQPAPPVLAADKRVPLNHGALAWHTSTLGCAALGPR